MHKPPLVYAGKSTTALRVGTWFVHIREIAQAARTIYARLPTTAWRPRLAHSLPRVPKLPRRWRPQRDAVLGALGTRTGEAARVIKTRPYSRPATDVCIRSMLER